MQGPVGARPKEPHPFSTYFSGGEAIVPPGFVRQSPMKSPITCRRAGPADLPMVSAFIWQINMAVIAPLEPAEAQVTFWKYIAPAAMAARTADHAVWVAEAGPTLVGALEVRHGTHVALLFVDRAYKGHGLGQALLEAAFGAPTAWPALTVNSNPPARRAYERMGFRAVGPEKEDHGLRFLPMRREADGAA